MSSQGDGPEVVENDRNEANRSEVKSRVPSVEPRVDFPIVECSLSELSYCYCVDESNRRSAEIGRRKLSTGVDGERLDFTTRQADMLSQLSTKQLLLLNRTPTLIDNLILRNRSALLQNQMEGRRSAGGGGVGRGRKPEPKTQQTLRPGRNKRSNSAEPSSPAVKRLKKGSAEEGGETSDSSSSRTTSLERIATRSNMALQENATRKKKLRKPGELLRFSARHGPTLRNGKKRVNAGPQAKIFKNAIKSKLVALSDRKKVKKKPADITDSNSNVFVETDADSDKKPPRRKTSNGGGNENKNDPAKNNEVPTKIVRKKRRKRDSMWVNKKVKKPSKPNVTEPKDTASGLKPKTDEDKNELKTTETADPPRLDTAPPEELRPEPQKVIDEERKNLKAEPKMPVLECQVDEDPVPDQDAEDVPLDTTEPEIEGASKPQETQEATKSETVQETHADKEGVSESVTNEVCSTVEDNTRVNSTVDNCNSSEPVTETEKKEEERRVVEVEPQEAVERPNQIDEETSIKLDDICKMSESEVEDVILTSRSCPDPTEEIVESQNDTGGPKDDVVVVGTEVDEVSSSQPTEENGEVEILKSSDSPAVLQESSVDESGVVDKDRDTDKGQEEAEDKVGEVGLAEARNDADSTSDVPGVLDEPSADDSFNDLSLYLPLDELPTDEEQAIKGLAKESEDNSCSSFTNIADIVLLDTPEKDVAKRDEGETTVLEDKKEEQLSSKEIEETLKDLSDITEREISKTDVLKSSCEEEDSCKDSGIQLEETFSSDKENSASSSFPEDTKSVLKQPQAEGVDQVICKSESETKEKIEIEETIDEKGTTVKVTEDPRTSAMKEAVLQALGLKSLAPATTATPTSSVPSPDKPKRVQDSGYTGTLKAVIKLNRGGDKKSRTMVYRRSDDKTLTTDKLEYKMISSEAQDTENTTNGNEMGSFLNSGTKQQAQPSPCIKDGTQQLDSTGENAANLNGSQCQGAEEAEADDKNGGLESNLVIPEKSSSFSIHPGRLCSDVCSYCFGKFGSLDTPCHVAQLKSEERQRKILQNEPHLTAESCLCDACYRYVDRRANFPNGAGGRTKTRPKPPVSSVCCVIQCQELATHTVKRKWLLKLKKSIINKETDDGGMPKPVCQ